MHDRLMTMHESVQIVGNSYGISWRETLNTVDKRGQAVDERASSHTVRMAIPPGEGQTLCVAADLKAGILLISIFLSIVSIISRPECVSTSSECRLVSPSDCRQRGSVDLSARTAQIFERVWADFLTASHPSLLL